MKFVNFIKRFSLNMVSCRFSSARRGQAAVLYALLTPIFLLFIGVAFDLGWYYLNVSRLQNAADSAAVAGAQTILESKNKSFSSYKSIALVKSYPGDDDHVYNVPSTSAETIENSNSTAADYASKNLSRNAGWTVEGDDYVMMDAWSPDNAKVTMNSLIYKNEKEDILYYVVKLQEDIRHFFLPGWFNSMPAPVTAVAMISKTDSKRVAGEYTHDEYTQSDDNTDKPNPISTKPTPSKSGRVAGAFLGSTELPLYDEDTNEVTEEFEEVLETFKNENVIVGNWQVQETYKNSGGGNVETANLNIKDSSGEKVTFVDSNGNELSEVTSYEARFGYKVYSNAWNHFQDFYNHYYLGDLYRKETVIIKDDVIFDENQNGDDIIDRNGTKGTISSYGKGKYGESSSVAATSAAINTDQSSLAYNPGKSTLKTYQDGITESDNVGLPYTWKRLDSINIDFRIENYLKGKWLSEDWDIELGFDDVETRNNKFETSGGEEVNRIRHRDVKRLRIHTSINFEDPYPVRPDVDKPNEPDILWARIESEPILYHPDVTDRARDVSSLGAKISSTGLNSVNQIIINFNKSNYDVTTQNYRPVIIFYDGPESYSIYSNYDTVNKFVRKSKPIIVNMNAGFRGVLYAPNSPVVVVGKAQNDFRGFILAKKYMRLKDDNDFIAAEDYLKGDQDLIYAQAYRYFNKPNRQYEYNRKVVDGTVKYQDVGKNDNTYSSQVKEDKDAYRLKVYYAKDDTETDPAKKKRYYKVIGKNAGEPNANTNAKTSSANTYETINGMKYIKIFEENGIDMYVDDYGEIQFDDLSSFPKKIGEYDNFSRTDFTTHNYHLLSSSINNMFLSGN